MTAPRTGDRRLEGPGAEDRARRLRARFKRASNHLDGRRRRLTAAAWFGMFLVWTAGLFLFGLLLLWFAGALG
jgi:hypothetical protein